MAGFGGFGSGVLDQNMVQFDLIHTSFYGCNISKFHQELPSVNCDVSALHPNPTRGVQGWWFLINI